MAANVLAFPNAPLSQSPAAPQRASPSAEEAAFNRPRFGLLLGGRSLDRSLDPLASQQMNQTLTPRPSRTLGRTLSLPAQVGIAVSHFDLEIAHYAARLRLLRDLRQQHSPTNLPA